MAGGLAHGLEDVLGERASLHDHVVIATVLLQRLYALVFMPAMTTTTIGNLGGGCPRLSAYVCLR